jgi:hypothetical protein
MDFAMIETISTNAQIQYAMKSVMTVFAHGNRLDILHDHDHNHCHDHGLCLWIVVAYE